jgi:hypothetical protein
MIGHSLFCLRLPAITSLARKSHITSCTQKSTLLLYHLLLYTLYNVYQRKWIQWTSLLQSSNQTQNIEKNANVTYS